MSPQENENSSSLGLEAFPRFGWQAALRICPLLSSGPTDDGQQRQKQASGAGKRQACR
jgi:hypothetical protein